MVLYTRPQNAVPTPTDHLVTVPHIASKSYKNATNAQCHGDVVLTLHHR